MTFPNVTEYDLTPDGASQPPRKILHNGQLKLLLTDINDSLRGWRFWVYLGWVDIAKQYRRSLIGPIWITLSTAVFIVGFALIGAQLFAWPLVSYLPYFCAGQIVFIYLSSLITDSSTAFTNAEPFLKQAPFPKMTFVLRVVFRNTIMFFHNIWVIFAVLIWSERIGYIRWPAFIAGLLFFFLVAVLVVGILSVITTRFRDVPMIINSVMQIAFFVTPVMWKMDQITDRAKWWMNLNPLLHFLEILRRPLLGEVVPTENWVYAIGMIPVLLLLFFVILVRSRRHIVYWL